MNKVIKCCRVGKSNQNRNYECQDYGIVINEEDFICGILADGAGSKKNSLAGAKMVVNATRRVLQNTMEKELGLQEIKKEIIVSCMQQYPTNKEEKHEMASTLLFYAVYKNRAIWGNIGDGIIIGCCGKQTTIIADAENGEYVNQTYFMTDDNVERHLRMGEETVIEQEARTVFLMTDGIAKKFYNPRSQKISEVCEQISSWGEKYSQEEIQNAMTENIEEQFIYLVKDDIGIEILYLGGE